MNQKLDRFTKYVNLYQKLIMVNAEKFVDHQSAEDVAQETFIKMLEHLDFLKDETVKQWLVVVSGNIAKDYAKKGGSVEVYPMEPCEMMEQMDNYTESAEESFEKEEKQKAARGLLRTACSLLYEKNPYWYYVMVDACIAGMSSAQIADALKITVSNVNVIKSRARRFLRKKLGKEYDEFLLSKFF